MCGIFGLVISQSHAFSFQAWEQGLKNLFLLSEARGKEAAGLAVARRDEILITKEAVSASEMLTTADYKRTLRLSSQWFGDPRQGEHALSAIGHSRLVTNGMQGIEANNQPVWREDVVLVHNGIVVNVDELWKKEAAHGLFPQAQVDTEIIAALFSRLRRQGASLQDALSGVMGEIYGETSVAMFCQEIKALLLATNTGSLFVCRAPRDTALFFTSEKYMCEQLMTGSEALPGFAGGTITQIKAGEGAIIALDTIDMSVFPVQIRTQPPAKQAPALSVTAPAQPEFPRGPLKAPAVEPLLGTQRRIENRASRYRDAMANMRRCTRCLLPETMPYIVYDAQGVCNYCHTYKPWVKRPEADLHTLLDKYRSKTGEPDCFMAFSGGRDSSYGLHLLKKKYGMTPLCFSYDWGMVTDVARRNQARMCGQLGVEHIWVSADIRQKRDNIRRNVAAWLKKPDLGLIPLFMAGDKQVLWHANRLMKETGIDIMTFCTNMYEKTDFKTGFLGIQSQAATIHKPSTLPMFEKAKMVAKYGVRFLANPAYLNRSLPDTVGAFFSYYTLEQNYFSLFDFIPWVEEDIDDVLLNTYDWERNPESQSTWRVGDGTAPFYNYIYHTVAGFTEYDTFRSNQIREGVLSRDVALARVQEENQPRWGLIRDYTRLINLDFDDCIHGIDRIKKLYVTE
jgi:glutamine---fructose-6-phosphate transaminase (isomerizing)